MYCELCIHFKFCVGLQQRLLTFPCWRCDAASSVWELRVERASEPAESKKHTKELFCTWPPPPPPSAAALSHSVTRSCHTHTHITLSHTHTPAWQALTAPGWLGWTALIAATLSDIVTQHYHTEVSRTQRLHTQLCHTHRQPCRTHTTVSHATMSHADSF